MRAIGAGGDVQMVIAAQRGDRRALNTLLSEYLPLLYNIVGRAMNGHADTDDVVQETMLRAVRGIGGLRDPAAFRSWLVAVAVRQVRDHRSSRQPPVLAADPAPEIADPGADFVETTILELGLTGQRRETAEATRWLDDEDQEVLALWWQEAAGELDRDAVASGLGISPAHTAVRISRMKERLTTARLVVRALRARPGCDALAQVTYDWDAAPSPLWRKRVARHARDCPRCQAHLSDMIPAEHLLNGLPLLPVPLLALKAASLLGHAGSGAHAAAGHAGHGTHAAAVTQAGTGSDGTHAARTVQAGSHTGHGTHAASHGADSAHVGAAHAGAAHASGSHAATAHAAGGARHLRLVPKIIASLQPKAVVAVVAATGAVAGGAIVVTHDQTGHHAPPDRVVAAAPTHPAPALSTPPPSPAPTHRPKPSPPARLASTLKGVGAWTFPGDTSALAQSGAAWYYNWSATPSGIVTPPGVSFVPMIWGSADVTAATLAQVKTEGRYLLGFNEPDLASQANMTVTQALSLWPQLMATGMQLGSPAVSADAAEPGGWLDQFMTGAKARGYRVNFITVHWYGADFATAAAVSQLRGYLQQIWQRYHLPIWMTELGLVSFAGGTSTYPTDAQQAAFVTASTAMLARLGYVRRYAWFGLGASPTDGNMGLFASGGAVTQTGRAFEAVSRTGH
jgi:RNA polymerase sigma factor (sigma-70 family)